MMGTFEFGVSDRNKIIVMTLSRWLICFLLLITACSNSIERENVLQPSTVIKTDEAEITIFPTTTPTILLSPETPTAPPSLQKTFASINLHPTKPPEKTKSPGVLFPISVKNANALSEYHVIEFNPWDLVTAAAWSPDGQHLAIAAGNHMYIFDVEKWERQNTLKMPAFTTSIAYSPDSFWLASGSRDGLLRIWGLQDAGHLNGDNPSPLLIIAAHKKGVNVVRFNDESNWVATGGNDAVARIWDLPSGELISEFIGGTFAVPSIAITPGEKTIAIVNGSVIRLRDVTTQSISGTFLSESSLYCIAINSKGNVLVVGDNENLIQIWDPQEAFRTGKEDYPTPLELRGHTGKQGSYRALIWQLAFNSAGNLLASAGGDGTVRLWNVGSGELLNTLDAHQAAVTNVSFNPGGTLLVTGSLDGTVRIWGVDR